MTPQELRTFVGKDVRVFRDEIFEVRGVLEEVLPGVVIVAELDEDGNEVAVEREVEDRTLSLHSVPEGAPFSIIRSAEQTFRLEEVQEWNAAEGRE